MVAADGNRQRLNDFQSQARGRSLLFTPLLFSVTRHWLRKLPFLPSPYRHWQYAGTTNQAVPARESRNQHDTFCSRFVHSISWLDQALSGLSTCGCEKQKSTLPAGEKSQEGSGQFSRSTPQGCTVVTQRRGPHSGGIPTELESVPTFRGSSTHSKCTMSPCSPATYPAWRRRRSRTRHNRHHGR